MAENGREWRDKNRNFHKITAKSLNMEFDNLDIIYKIEIS
jgi:hypothetical protein